MRISFSLLILILILKISVYADTIKTLREAINLSIKNNPSIKAAETQKEIYKNRSYQTEASLLPQINLSGGYTRTSPLPGITTNKDNNNQYDLYSIGIDLKMNLYDFKRTKYLSESYRFLENSASYELDTVKSQVIIQVIINYYRLLQANENLNVAIQTKENLEKHLQSAQAFYRAGLKPKYDITKAEVNLSNADLNIIKAQNSIKLLESELKKLIGLNSITFNLSTDNLILDDTQEIASLFEKGLKQRRELLSIREKIKSAELTLKATKTSQLPTLNLESSYLRSGPHPDMEKDGWSIGVKFNLPLYNGNLTNYQINEVLSNISNLRYLEQLQILSIKYEIETAYLSLIEAKEKYTLADVTLKQAEENYEIARGRYNAGLSNPIELSDAEIELEKSRLNKISAKYDYLISQAMLKKATGELYEY